MKFLSEYRDAEAARRFAAAIAARVTKPHRIMEVCGGQTHSIVRYGIDQLLPEQVTLLHGPGCPVCVTPLETIDQAIAIAERSDVTFCSFGDMLRVPGSRTDLAAVKARGGDVRVVYSPLDAVRLAQDLPKRQVVFFAVGFETTAPANAMAVKLAAQLNLDNFALVVSHVLVPPALTTLLSAPGCRIDGFLAAGHVCTVMGVDEYRPIAARYGVPIVVTGFEPVDLLQGILMCVDQLESGRTEVENQYARSVVSTGNQHAQQAVAEVFEVATRNWRGIGAIEQSGLQLRQRFAQFDALVRFGVAERRVAEPSECISGLVLQGRKKPTECPAFGTRCTPDHPLGATMVSNEGACAAYYRFRRRADDGLTGAPLPAKSAT
jgi:hydrogenase expression/formation protein HypD